MHCCRRHSNGALGYTRPGARLATVLLQKLYARRRRIDTVIRNLERRQQLQEVAARSV